MLGRINTQGSTTARLLALLATVLVGITPALAHADNSIPTYALKVGGRVDRHGTSWGIWMFGKNGQGCWATRSWQANTLVGEGVACGYSVPPRLWQLGVSGPMGEADKAESVLFFLTRPTVKALFVLARFKERANPLWIRIPAHKIRAPARRQARLPSGVGYAIHAFHGHLTCEGRVKVYGVSGKLLDSRTLSECANIDGALEERSQ